MLVLALSNSRATWLASSRVGASTTQRGSLPRMGLPALPRVRFSCSRQHTKYVSMHGLR
jgi:hypothetical protein